MLNEAFSLPQVMRYLPGCVRRLKSMTVRFFFDQGEVAVRRTFALTTLFPVWASVIFTFPAPTTPSMTAVFSW
jgi:hypothetical protein